jgi:hypothetical protein
MHDDNPAHAGTAALPDRQYLLERVGEAAVESILKARTGGGLFKTFADMLERVDLRALNKKAIESLVKSGACDPCPPAPCETHQAPAPKVVVEIPAPEVIFQQAQPSANRPTLGLLIPGSPASYGQRVAALVQRLRELGWVDGRTIVIEYRWAATQHFDEIAAEFVRSKVDVIFTSGTPPALAAMRATSQIPIVFAPAGDPLASGLVASLVRPGGNITGLSNQTADIAGKRVELDRVVRLGPVSERGCGSGRAVGLQTVQRIAGIHRQWQHGGAVGPELGLGVHVERRAARARRTARPDARVLHARRDHRPVHGFG